MDEGTFKSRLVDLLKKSRKAIRLYEGMGRSGSGLQSVLADAQAAEWRNLNSELMQDLVTALDEPSQKRLAIDVFAIRERFSSIWHKSESELLRKQTDLLSAAKNGDFVRSTLLSNELAVLKARVQAAQAVHHELSDVIKRSKVSIPEDDLIPEIAPVVELPQLAQIIPLKR